MFIGRKFELSQLNTFFNRKIAGLAVCCGRRRIGKSTLIQHAAKNTRFLEFYGLPPRKAQTNQAQLDHFSTLLAKNFNIPKAIFSNWHDALTMLATLSQSGPYIIFLDEISWMGGKDPDFPGKLKGLWDTHFKKNPELRLIICGSVSSWIQKNILKNKGFMGRTSLTITLKELPLHDANRFWQDHPLISTREKFKLLSVTGGVPRYLEEIDPHLSAEQNIKQLCFTPGGILLDEYDKIFNDLFGKKRSGYEEIITTILNRSLTVDEICKKLNCNPSGAIYEKLTELKECGFIEKDCVWAGDKKSRKLNKYRLKDNYIRFYLKYIAPQKNLIEEGLLNDVNLENLTDWESIMGLQFENLVLSNLPAIRKLLDIAPESLLSAAPYFQNPTKRQPGCQIDFLFQTTFTYYVGEIKFAQQIGLEIIQEVSEKIGKLDIPKGISVRPVLIYQGDLSKNIISQNYFSHLISFKKLLEK